MGKTLLRLGALMVIDASALGFAYALYANGTIAFAAVLIAVTALVNVIFLSERLAPWRWISPGLALMVLLVLYPTAYTVYIGFTNYGDQHLLSRGQAVAQLEDEYFIPEGAPTYDWTAYQSSGGNLLLYLESEETQPFIVTADGTQPAAERLGTEPGGPPEQIDDFARLDQTETVGLLARLENFAAPSGDAGPQGSEVRILSLDEAAPQRQKYDYEALSGELTDNETGTVYTAEDGFFVSEEGERISPGFAAVVGVENFTRIFTDPDIRGPFVGVFIWTLVFAALSVVTTFALGVGLALLLNDQQLPFRGLFRSLTIIPYTIPFFITALVWVGLLNPIYGPINQIIEFFTGLSPQWFSDGTLAKVAILMINLWLGFPYMMIVCLGALQSIPEEVHEAAAIDGANAFHRFFYMTLPLLLVSVGPLLLGVFAFNFNNFGIIELVTQGGPPNPEAGTPAGQTDILISYTYRLAFASGQGTDYGLAAAVSVFIFILVALITIFNFRLTRKLEEVS
jgi:ABC-type sugar transport system permease subunit